jgi:hypothetical protein
MTIRPTRALVMQDAGRERLLAAGVCEDVPAPVALALIASGDAERVSVAEVREVAAVDVPVGRGRGRRREVAA